jgi:hypothetical protein
MKYLILLLMFSCKSFQVNEAVYLGHSLCECRNGLQNLTIIKDQDILLYCGNGESFLYRPDIDYSTLECK